MNPFQHQRSRKLRWWWIAAGALMLAAIVPFVPRRAAPARRAVPAEESGSPPPLTRALRSGADVAKTAPAEPRSLISPGIASPGDPGVAPELPPAHRMRVTTIDPAWLDRKFSPLLDPAYVGSLVPLPLWPDRMLQVRLRGADVVGSDRHLVRGEIDGVPGSRFLLTMAGPAVSFSVLLGAEERHGAVTLSGGRLAIYELDAHAAPGCATPLPALPDSDALAAAAARPMAMRTSVGGAVPASEPPVGAAPPVATAQIDVLMLYTNEVSADVQPGPSLVSRVDLAIAEANDEYLRSETRVRLRLVGLRQVIYPETGSNSTALDRVRKTTDGFIDEVHASRDELGADLVCLLVQRSDSSNVGIAYITTSISDPDRAYNDLYGFSVVQYAWLTGGSIFAHELGHNLGCSHDRENTSTAGIFPFSYGYRFTGADARTYRTIMAYSPGTSLPYFSNPRLTHPDPLIQRPLGVTAGLPGEADNAASINRAAYYVASYRSNRLDPPARGRLHNVSTRAWVGVGEQALIGGFFVGTPGPKQVLLRVRGPGLAAFGVADVLPDPELELVDQGTGLTLATNHDWGTAANAAAIAATGFAPGDPREAAILVELPAGGYTAVARGVGGAAGVAIIEVFEIDANSGPKLINLSTRGHVDTGERVMIGGVIVHGNAGETKRLLFRAIGPSLTTFGVANPLFDPAMRLYNQASEELMENDDWDLLPETLQAQIVALNLAPTVRRESVLLVDLPPGHYTLIVRPFENDTGIEPGVGLIEAYEITTP